MTRCAFVIDQTLPRGLIANAAAILAMTLGKERPDLIGHAVHDADGNCHQGITTIVMPMLMSDAGGLMELRIRAAAQEASGLGMIGRNGAARQEL
ncbi:hypothetical protein SAMCCGM7_pC0064 (plasmid) [Sinorhizobium americanum CCGM7]|uniref:DUF2000 family protein n=1 Tax=Sinorhizobium americanum TaxID=194963 RepID=UPI0004D6EDAF|nr:DUF2000 family protein [Sinorhizobium americanum]APG87270.1 hypothetical protein SAMCCGM7_pC0064 [Sinorhizobium americanum CCGM7]